MPLVSARNAANWMHALAHRGDVDKAEGATFEIWPTVTDMNERDRFALFPLSPGVHMNASSRVCSECSPAELRARGLQTCLRSVRAVELETVGRTVGAWR